MNKAIPYLIGAGIAVCSIGAYKLIKKMVIKANQSDFEEDSVIEIKEEPLPKVEENDVVEVENINEVNTKDLTLEETKDYYLQKGNIRILDLTYKTQEMLYEHIENKVFVNTSSIQALISEMIQKNNNMKQMYHRALLKMRGRVNKIQGRVFISYIDLEGKDLGAILTNYAFICKIRPADIKKGIDRIDATTFKYRQSVHNKVLAEDYIELLYYQLIQLEDLKRLNDILPIKVPKTPNVNFIGEIIVSDKIDQWKENYLKTHTQQELNAIFKKNDELYLVDYVKNDPFGTSQVMSKEKTNSEEVHVTERSHNRRTKRRVLINN